MMTRGGLLDGARPDEPPAYFHVQKRSWSGQTIFPQPSYSLTKVRFRRELCWLIETDRLRADRGPLVAARRSVNSYNAP